MLEGLPPLLIKLLRQYKRSVSNSSPRADPANNTKKQRTRILDEVFAPPGCEFGCKLPAKYRSQKTSWHPPKGVCLQTPDCVTVMRARERSTSVCRIIAQAYTSRHSDIPA